MTGLETAVSKPTFGLAFRLSTGSFDGGYFQMVVSWHLVCERAWILKGGIFICMSFQVMPCLFLEGAVRLSVSPPPLFY